MCKIKIKVMELLTFSMVMLEYHMSLILLTTKS